MEKCEHCQKQHQGVQTLCPRVPIEEIIYKNSEGSDLNDMQVFTMAQKIMEYFSKGV